DRVSFGAFLLRLTRIVGASEYPLAQVGLVLGGGVQHRNRFVSFLVVRIVLQHALVGLDRIASSLQGVGGVHARLVLLVHDAGNENQRCLVIWIERECAFGVLLGLFEMAFLIRLG